MPNPEKSRIRPPGQSRDVAIDRFSDNLFARVVLFPG